MKNTLKTILAVAVLGAASAAHAISIPSSGSVDISKTGVDGGVGGGAFNAVVDGDHFYTFCVQEDVLISVPGTFDYVLAGVTSKGKALSEGAAYLFKRFALGQLFSVVPANSSLAGQLQLALWYFQGEVDAADVVGNLYTAMATAALGTNGKGAYTGTEVRVMQLSKNGKDVQDQLVYVPDSGTTLALLGLALSGLAIASRRRNV